MDELGEILKSLGIEKPDDVDVEIKHRAFLPSGIKVLKYYGHNLLEIFEIETQTMYQMEYTNFTRIFREVGFTKKSIKAAESLILNERYTIVDFNNLEIGVKDLPRVTSPIGAYITHTIENYDEIISDLHDSDPFHKNLQE